MIFKKDIFKTFPCICLCKKEPLWRPHATPGDYDLNKLESYLHEIASTQDTAFLARWNIIKSILKKFYIYFYAKIQPFNVLPPNPGIEI